MKPTTIDDRIAAYATAVNGGAPRYGARGRPGERSALQVAAQALGLKKPARVLAALKARDHADVLARAARIKATHLAKVEAKARRAVISAANASAGARLAQRRPTPGRDALADAADRQRAAAQRKGDKRAKRAARDLAERIRLLGRDASPADHAAMIILRSLDGRPTGVTLTALFARGQITAGELATAAEFRRCVEAAHASPISGVDFTQEAVDGGRGAGSRLPGGWGSYEACEVARARAVLGEIGFAFLVGVVVAGRSLTEVGDALLGAHVGRRGRTPAAYYSGRLREILGELVERRSTKAGVRRDLELTPIAQPAGL